ncbi:hypothetical protein L218DRAFT_935763, partial [Marasmius fiardii PR-910]
MSERPTAQQSWETILRQVDRLDEDQVRGYKEDIDTLLVFAGLFSGVVTAFSIESYKWLTEDSSEIAVALLREIVQQNRGQTPTDPMETFSPSPEVVRINTFWFLSLALALVDALFGLLCKQWVREHQRQTNTRTPRQALALRWLRYQSFERWHVPAILSSLPILLEIALFLFLAGLLQLLYSLHHVPFGFSCVIVGLAWIFYLATTILPGISIVQHAFQIHPYFVRDSKPILDPIDLPRMPSVTFVCPYKSPQSWAIFKLISSMYYIPGFRKCLHSYLTTFNRYWTNEWNDISNLDLSVAKNVSNLSGWDLSDLNVVQRFSRIKGCPDVYELKGFRWLVQETRDNPSILPHLKRVLGELPRHLAMFAVFNRW